ncbi:hypothetical protein PC110_g21526 [Phytophthora cactorum]|uniref:Uncharacterized protein n=1 Tax=Phytophthora cactorum TaxID=29920 RepID=A0A329RF41_9STRA|nr:hypothetical protein PC110_g21526 [Phytophthora cactorum]
MVWASITADGVETMQFCDESVTGAYYRTILRSNIPITKQFLGLDAKLYLYKTMHRPITQKLPLLV